MDDDGRHGRWPGLVTAYADYEVLTAHDGREAMEVAPEFRQTSSSRYGGFPSWTGMRSVAQRLRKSRETGSEFLIAVSGYGQEERRRRRSRKPASTAISSNRSSFGACSSSLQVVPKRCGRAGRQTG